MVGCYGSRLCSLSLCVSRARALRVRRGVGHTQVRAYGNLLIQAACRVGVHQGEVPVEQGVSRVGESVDRQGREVPMRRARREVLNRHYQRGVPWWEGDRGGSEVVVVVGASARNHVTRGETQACDDPCGHRSEMACGSLADRGRHSHTEIK